MSFFFFFLFGKAVKKLLLPVFIQQVLFWVAFVVLGVLLKIKLMKLSCLQNFLWLQSLLCVFNRNVFEGKLLFCAPGWSVSPSDSLLQRHRAFVVAVRWDPHGVWSHPGILLPCVVAGHNLSVWAELPGVGMALSPLQINPLKGRVDWVSLSCAPLPSFDSSVNTICIPPSQDRS